MKEFELEWIGEVREIYVVEADTEEEARENWHETEPVHSEAYGGAIKNVREIK